MESQTYLLCDVLASCALAALVALNSRSCVLSFRSQSQSQRSRSSPLAEASSLAPDALGPVLLGSCGHLKGKSVAEHQAHLNPLLSVIGSLGPWLPGYLKGLHTDTLKAHCTAFLAAVVGRLFPNILTILRSRALCSLLMENPSTGYKVPGQPSFSFSVLVNSFHDSLAFIVALWKSNISLIAALL